MIIRWMTPRQADSHRKIQKDLFDASEETLYNKIEMYCRDIICIWERGRERNRNSRGRDRVIVDVMIDREGLGDEIVAHRRAKETRH